MVKNKKKKYSKKISHYPDDDSSESVTYYYGKKNSSSESDKHYGKKNNSSESKGHYSKSSSSSKSDKHQGKQLNDWDSSESESKSKGHYSKSSSSSSNSSSSTYYYGKNNGYNFNKHHNRFSNNKHHNRFSNNKHHNRYSNNKHHNRFSNNKHHNRYSNNKCGLVHTGNHGSYGKFLGKFESTIYHGVSIKFKLFEEGIKGHLYISQNIGHKLSAISINKNEFTNGQWLAGPILFWLATSSHWEKGIAQITPYSNYPCCHNYSCNLLAPKGTPYIHSLIGKTTSFSYRFKVDKCKYNCQTLRHFVKNWFVIYGKQFKTIHGGIKKNCHRCGNNGSFKKIGVHALARSHLNKIILY